MHPCARAPAARGKLGQHGAAHHEERGFTPTSPVLPLLDSLLIPLSECWVWGGADAGVCEQRGAGSNNCPGQRGWCRAALPLPSTCNVSRQGRALG